MKIVSYTMLGLLVMIVSMTVTSDRAHAAQWLAPASDERVTADWVHEIEADLTGERFRNFFMGIPSETPIPAILHNLNGANQALADNNKALAKTFIEDAIGILDNGVAKGWYTRSDVAPVKSMIEERSKAAIEGKTVADASNPRWTGYTETKKLGLSNAPGEKQATTTDVETDKPSQ